MGGSGGGGSGKTTYRYASYIEGQHATFLNDIAAYKSAVIDDSPFDGYEPIAIETAFFGAGLTLSSYDALFELYGEHMSGMDIDTLWTEIFSDTVNSVEVDNLVAAESALLDDDLESNVLPRFQTGMRDTNSIISSSYIVGKSLIEETKVRSLAKLDAELRYRLIPVAEARWKTQLQWHQQAVTIYAELLKFYIAARMDTDEANYSIAAKNALWPFTVLDFERAALGALQGAYSLKSDLAGGGLSTGAKAISGALAGAAMGASIGGPIGAGVGGVLGAVGGLIS